MAAAAKVKTVVLSHLRGAGGGDGDADPFTADVRKFFSGEVIVGTDQMRL
jgi:ribonuclease BN (tRNA processing enzyme)